MIKDAIDNYLNMQHTGALLISGTWGCGKTYYIKNELFSYIREQVNPITSKKYIPVIISLFGIEAKEDVLEQVFLAYCKQQNIDSQEIAENVEDDKTQKIKDKIKTKGMQIILGAEKLLGKSEFIKTYFDFSGLLSKGKNLINMLDENTIICFDDFERLPKEVKKDDFLGLVNDLVENCGFKVIIVANEKSFEDNEIQFKEKVIEKTVRYIPNIPEIVSSILLKYRQDTNFQNYMTSDFVKESLICQSRESIDVDINDLHDKLINIRALKFAIEHFFRIYQNLSISNPLTTQDIKKLNNIWTFVLAVSIEYKYGELSIDNMKQIDSYEKIASLDIDDEFYFSGNNESYVSEKENYISGFIATYFTRINQPFHFYKGIYDFICGGININFQVLEEKINMEIEEHTNPSMDLLNSFLQGYWNMDDETFRRNLSTLLDYTEKGELNGAVSYINAATYLMHYALILSDDEDLIKTKVFHGIDLYIKRSNFNYLEISNLKVMQDSIQPEAVEFADYIEQKMNEKKQWEFAQNILDLESKFQRNMIEFASEFSAKEQYQAPPMLNTPILHQFNMDMVKDKIKNISNSEIACLSNFLKYRYIQNQFKTELVQELSFLQAIKAGLQERNISSPTLSNFLIKDTLTVSLDKSFQIIERIIS